jgi:hypothetical protein
MAWNRTMTKGRAPVEGEHSLGLQREIAHGAGTLAARRRFGIEEDRERAAPRNRAALTPQLPLQMQ